MGQGTGWLPAGVVEFGSVETLLRCWQPEARHTLCCTLPRLSKAASRSLDGGGVDQQSEVPAGWFAFESEDHSCEQLVRLGVARGTSADVGI